MRRNGNPIIDESIFMLIRYMNKFEISKFFLIDCAF